MKKSIITIICLSLAIAPLAAEDYATLMFKARGQSRSLENAELQHRNQILREEDETEDGVGVSVSASVTPISKGAEIAHDGFNISQLETTVTLPNPGKTSITVKAPMNIGYDGAFTMQPKVTAEHTFRWGEHDTSLTDDLQSSINTMQGEKSWHEASLSFDRQVISAMQQLLRSEKSIKNYQHQVENQERSLRESVELGRVTEGSVQWKRTDNSIKKTRRSLESAIDQYETQKRKFKNLTGEDWTGVENIPSYSLKVSVLPSGNTEVIIKSMQQTIAEQKVEDYGKGENVQSITLSGGIGGNVVNSLTPMGRNSMNGNVGVRYSSPSWSVNGSFSLSGSTPEDITPRLTIGGTWSTGPKPGRGVKGENLETLQNDAVQKANAHADAVISYNEKGRDLQEKIEDWNWRVSEQRSDLEFLRDELEFEKELLAEGLSTERDVAEAGFQVELAEMDEDMLKLEGLSLAYDLASYAL